MQKYHFIDNWDGHIHRFASLAKAKKAAKDQTGVSVTIYCGGSIAAIVNASGYTPA